MGELNPCTDLLVVSTRSMDLNRGPLKLSSSARVSSRLIDSSVWARRTRSTNLATNDIITMITGNEVRLFIL